MMPQLKRLGFGNYTLIRKSDSVKIGTAGLYDREGIEGLDIGFALLPQFEGKGYAYESNNKLKEVALSEFKITSLNAITDKQNVSSQKLLERLGLNFKKHIILPNETEEVMLYQLFEREN